MSQSRLMSRPPSVTFFVFPEPIHSLVLDMLQEFMLTLHHLTHLTADSVTYNVKRSYNRNQHQLHNHEDPRLRQQLFAVVIPLTVRLKEHRYRKQTHGLLNEFKTHKVTSTATPQASVVSE
mmetsp:Transcript_30151/g.53028  ORF Transcript_30151/g.53028 Transcript_30151/m.53028 type:complete len:121 (-) Transcript_30151:741-1103(-)